MTAETPRDRLQRQLLELSQTVARLQAAHEGLPTADQFAGTVATLTTHVGDLAARLEALEQRTEDQQPTLWDWTTLDGEAARQTGHLLRQWVDGVLKGWYRLVGWEVLTTKKASGLRKIPECWEQHSDLLIELSWLAQEWLRVYRTTYGTPAKAGDWHDRYLTGLRRRIPDTSAGRCLTEHVDPAAVVAPPVDGARPSMPQPRPY